MSENTTSTSISENQVQNQLEEGTYEILQSRLRKQGDQLQQLLTKLNTERKEVFGSIETKLMTTERVNTVNNCIPCDMVPVGNYFLFGYNVHIGLKNETNLSDVFSLFTYRDHSFHEEELKLIQDKSFMDDFQKLYKYYKNTHFVKFFKRGVDLHMVFRIGKDVTDVKTFKWQISGNGLKYIDNRSDHEFMFPEQYDFSWTKTTRDDFRSGNFPHISIKDKVFVETVGGDLTVKIEDNTDNGRGIYSEPVDHKDQTMEDSDIYYAIVGNVVLLKIKPYQEDFRYIVYNSKIQKARRVDEIKDACILLPDDHGLIFTNGYYLQSGEYKQFDNELKSMVFEKRIASPNGEDYLYVFYNRENGIYLLMHYNLIEQQVENPIICHGFSIFENGEMCLFRGDEEPKKHHAIQIWRTPYTGPDFKMETTNSSYLNKIGNKDVVKAMAECNELLNLINKDDTYSGLYLDLIKNSTDIIDSYHWLDAQEYDLKQPLNEIRKVASSAVDEFEKVQKIRENTDTALKESFENADVVIKEIKTTRVKTVDQYVQQLADLRKVRGEVISLNELRYADVEHIKGYEDQLATFYDQTSQNTIKYLLKDKALEPYQAKVVQMQGQIEAVAKVVEAEKTEEQILSVSQELELLIEIVSNLEIKDATETTKIIDNISQIYSQFNQLKAALKRKRKELFSVEGQAEFNAQMKLIDQAVINYLDICDSAQKCEEYLSKVMVQLEELEGKFSEFNEFIDKLSVKRDEVYNAFENKRILLIEEKNKRANTLQLSADRIIKSVQSRISRFTSEVEINGYYASDIMLEKARNIIQELEELGDTVKSEDIVSRLKTAKEDAIRQLKDKTDLFVNGKDLIKFGEHQFAVNSQNLDLTIVNKDDTLFHHLTGTNFFEAIKADSIKGYEQVMDQSLLSENDEVYRAEYLAYMLLEHAKIDSDISMENLYEMTDGELKEHVTKFMSVRYDEGYIKGVHDHDGVAILRALLNQIHTADLLLFSSNVRAVAALFWKKFLDQERKQFLNHQLKSAGIILKVFPGTKEFDSLLNILKNAIGKFIETTQLFDLGLKDDAAFYLFKEISRGDKFVMDKNADDLYNAFKGHLRKHKAQKLFDDALKGLMEDPSAAYQHVVNWVNSFVQSYEDMNYWEDYVHEVSVVLLANDYNKNKVVHVSLQASLEDLQGDHKLIQEGKYELQYNHFMSKLKTYHENVVPLFRTFNDFKKEVTASFREEMRLNEFKPRVMSSFVRNKLIDEVYLPLIGANLAKQIGAAGDKKRTDLMGLLLLISPPGYGKTTLMEYIANRLGVIFMKINGPALGHDVLSLDPEQAPNAGAREELKKLNLAFEMGDNVMIYLDDIQHCNPEFLQKFISLCDAQRKIEGVYKGRSRTYDFRGKRVSVVMAGNPYTESGEKFRIPDMLANRADIYNLGDIIGDTEEVFKLSYLENSLTSNSVMAKLAGKSHKDVITMARIATTGKRDGEDFEASYSAEEITEYIEILKKLLKVRDVILSVNQEYIYSAAQSDEYRTEPPFKLQGSYRDMNKITEKVVSVMNDEELDNLILTHYESESQTLTSGAEANLLKFKSLIGTISKDEKKRWDKILQKFQKQQELLGYGNQTGLVVKEMENISKHLDGIREEMLLLNLKRKERKGENK
ncbi:MAG: DNA repair ATPase [Fulvivirga sp.]